MSERYHHNLGLEYKQSLPSNKAGEQIHRGINDQRGPHVDSVLSAGHFWLLSVTKP